MKREGVFISYSRKDGLELARGLREELNQREHKVWHDIERLDSNEGWRNQISEALDNVETMVLIATPEAMKSDDVISEWEEARTKGVFIAGLLPSEPRADLSRVQRCIGKTHFYDFQFEEQETRFFDKLKNPPPVPKFVNLVAKPPEDYVQRESEYNAILERLVDKDGNPKQGKVVIRGAGGMGKSTLVEGICHSDLITQAFCDGVWRVRLGPEPENHIHHLNDILKGIIENPPTFEVNFDFAISRINQYLENREVLLVLDDVWDRMDLSPYLDLNTTLLITTRNVVIVRKDEPPIEIHEMTTNEAENLIGLRGIPQVKQILRRIGNYPLLISLIRDVINNRINRRDYPESAADYVLDALEREGVTYFDSSNEKDREHAVRVTLDLSIELLSEEDKERLFQLAIFPEAIRVSFEEANRLWRIDTFNADTICRRFDELSLLRSIDYGTREFSFHDIIRHYLREQNIDSLPNWNTEYLAGFDTRSWHYLPDQNSYIWQHLAYHLIEADKDEELFRLLTDDPQWMNRKYELFGSDSSYTSDVRHLLNHLKRGSSNSKEFLPHLTKLHGVLRVVSERAQQFDNADLRVLVWLDREHIALDYALARVNVRDNLLGLTNILDALDERKVAIDKRKSVIRRTLHLLNEFSSDDLLYERVVSKIAFHLIRAREFEAAVEFMYRIRSDVYEYAKFLKQHAAELRERWGDEKLLGEVAYCDGQISKQGFSDEYKITILLNLAEAMSHTNEEKDNLLDQALNIVSTQSEASDNVIYSKLHNLCKIAEILAKLGIHEKLNAVLDEIKILVNQGNTVSVNAGRVAITLARIGRQQDAENYLSNTSSSLSSAHVHAIVAQQLFDKGNYDKAIDHIRAGIAEFNINDSSTNILDDLRIVIQTLFRLELVEEAVSLGEDITNSHYRDAAFTYIAIELGKNKEYQRGYEVFQRIPRRDRLREDTKQRIQIISSTLVSLTRINTQSDIELHTLINKLKRILIEEVETVKIYDKERAINMISWAISYAGDADMAITLANEVRDNGERAACFHNIGRALAQDQESISRFRDSIELCVNEMKKILEVPASQGQNNERIIKWLTEVLLIIGKLEAAKEEANRLPVSFNKSHLFRQIGEEYAKLGQRTVAKSILNEALTIARSMKTFVKRLEATDITFRIPSDGIKAGALINIAYAFQYLESPVTIVEALIEDAFVAANEVEDIPDSIMPEFHYSESMKHIAIVLSRMKRLNQAIDTLNKIPDPFRRVLAYSTVAREANFDNENRLRFLEKAQDLLPEVMIEQQNSARQNMATAYISLGMYHDAFDLTERHSLIEFIDFISSDYHIFENIDDGTYVWLMKNLLNLVVFVYPSWEDVRGVFDISL